MTIFLFTLVIVTVLSSKFNLVGFYDDYISKDSIEPIKGIFLVFVFLTHFAQYIPLDGAMHTFYALVRKKHGQLIVTPFLFYSGYGVFESIKKKGSAYVRTMPVNRCLKLLMDFDIAIFIYYILSVFDNKNYPIKKILLSFIGWDSLRNSNWYIFVILGMYIISFLAFYGFDYETQKEYIVTTIVIMTIVFSYFISLHKETYWYNTIWCYVAGGIYSVYKNEIEKNILSNNKSYFISFFNIILLFICFYSRWYQKVSYYQLASVAFSLIIVFISIKIKVTNKFLNYCGRHLFSLYILQRLPMIFFQNTVLSENVYVYFVACAVITVLISAIFDRFTAMLWKSATKVK